jgi:c-di-GMP-binding flagellar brake protein YcgR
MFEELQKALKPDLRTQITVWDPGDDTVEYTFSSYVMEIDGAFFMVAPPNKQMGQILPLMQKDMVVGVVLETYPNPYILYPVIYAQPSSPDSGYWLQIPKDPQIEIVQRRRHVRIPMVLPMEIEYELGPKWIPLEARTEDVSGGGMRFTSPRSFFKGQKLLIHIRFNNELPIMHLKAHVVFSAENRIRKRPDDIYATACQFEELDDQQEMLIVRECFRRELGGRH